MKLKKILITIAVVILLGVGAFLLFGRNQAKYVDDVSPEELKNAYTLLAGSVNSADLTLVDYKLLQSLLPGKGNYEIKKDLQELNYQKTIEYTVNADADGIYYLALDYKPADNTYLEYTISIAVNGKNQYSEQKTIALPIIWKDSVSEYQTDRYGDQIAPVQSKVPGVYKTYLFNNTYSSAAPLPVSLKKGANTITITNVSNDGLEVGSLYVESAESKAPDYTTYKEKYKDKNVVHDLISINATDYTDKNSAEIIYQASQNPALYPFNAEYKKLNILSWTSTGAEINYTVKVEKDGLYAVALHYSNDKEETNSFQTIRIDGQVPFKEFESYPFEYTSGSWANKVLADEKGNPYYVYLTAGEHKLTIKTEGEAIAEALRYGRLIAAHVTDFALEIKKIAGENPDKYRTWKMTQYIPEIADYLAAYKTLLQHIRYTLQYDMDYGTNSALMSYLDKAEQFVTEMAEYPDEIALYTSDLTGRDNSMLVAMSTFTSALMKESFSLDRIYLCDSGKKLPAAKANVFKTAGNSIAGVYYSFTSPKYKIKDNDDEVLEIWVNRALTHVDLLQKMVDTEFTPKTGIKVKISVMPDANKLTLASAANDTPDVALGLSSYMPFDLACRGALYDLTRFPDFWETAGRFAPGTMVPYTYNEGIYAIPETMDFAATIYRTDIFNNLNLEVPDTWDELINLLPTLQRYGMNFYHNISSGVGYKWFYQTTPLLYQNGGHLYTDDGMSTAIDSVESVQGLKRLGELFVAYSLDTTVNEFFNSFRYSTLPIGICDSNTYILIKNGAAELQGQWALAPYLGTKQEDGSVARWYVANGSGGVIFKDTDKAEEAWAFLKWWTEKETAVEYTYTLRSSYGDTYFWLPSNLEALEQAPIDQEDKEIILSMSEWLRDVPRTPGQYLLERSISDIWNAMVLDGESAQVAADEKVIEINREIKKKMKELGFYDEAGNMLKPYVIRDIDWIRANIEKAGKEKR